MKKLNEEIKFLEKEQNKIIEQQQGCIAMINEDIDADLNTDIYDEITEEYENNEVNLKDLRMSSAPHKQTKIEGDMNE
jgi:calcineurin-like phosphoesterase family protein